MPPLPVINAKQFIKFLETLGFRLIRQKGSHKRFKHTITKKSITVPDHGKETLKRGLLNAMLNDINVSVADLINFLNK